MIGQNKIATVFGGTGFVGRQVVRELARLGYTIKVATRVPERAYDLKPCGTPGQVVPVLCTYTNDDIAAAIDGSCAVVNCVGILYERGRAAKFRKAHVEIPAMIAAASKARGVERLVHISALGIDTARSRYAASKRDGEAEIRKAFPAAIILRPSVIFGPGDGLFGMFAELARYLPALPLIGGGKTRFQPVFVGDVADAVMAALALPHAPGQTFELGGPEIVSFREIYGRLFHHTGRKRILVTLPFFAAKVQAGFLSLLPRPPLTPDQVESLKTDSVVTPGAPDLASLGIVPRGMNAILPGYLETFRPGGRFGDKKSA